MDASGEEKFLQCRHLLRGLMTIVRDECRIHPWDSMFTSSVLILKIVVPVGPHVLIDPADVRLAWFTNRVETGPHCPGRLGSQQVHAWRLPVSVQMRWCLTFLALFLVVPFPSPSPTCSLLSCAPERQLQAELDYSGNSWVSQLHPQTS